MAAVGWEDSPGRDGVLDNTERDRIYMRNTNSGRTHPWKTVCKLHHMDPEDKHHTIGEPPICAPPSSWPISNSSLQKAMTKSAHCSLSLSAMPTTDLNIGRGDQ